LLLTRRGAPESIPPHHESNACPKRLLSRIVTIDTRKAEFMASSPSKRRTTRVTGRQNRAAGTESTALAASAGILAAGEPLGRSFDRCLEVCMEALAAASAAVLLLDDDGAHLRPVAAAGLDPESLEPVTAPPTGDLDAWAASAAPMLAAAGAPQ